ncbi:MAG: TetR/AcrR family transcriptional regulator [Actinomycetota bacterium]|nr:TetR/AcrR family transcriptional regulator [Actinomycetota bacterium]
MEEASGPRSGSQGSGSSPGRPEDTDGGGRSAEPIPVELGRVGPPARRRDAQRNRARLIEATRHLLGDHRLDDLAVDEIAEEAGVGKGTVYRAFGDKAGLAMALLDEETRMLQDAVLTGPPPLGPGAAATERLDAFVDAYVGFLDRNVELLLVCEKGPERRYDNAVFGFWLTYVRAQLQLVDGVADHDATAHLLLTALRADLYRHLRAAGYDRARIARMARRALAPG